jgi:exopolysaccharide biosynthesis polyprenyl glycosylphosphotransferase
MATLESFPEIPLEEALTGRRTEHKLVRFLIGADSLALLLAVSLSVAIRGSAAATYTNALIWAGTTIVFAVLIFAAYRLYERDRQHIAVSSLDEAGDLFNALTLLSFAEVCVTETLARSGVRTVGIFTVLIFWSTALILVPLGRAIFRHLVVPLLDNPQNTVIIGAGHVGQNVARKIRKHPEYNLRLVGFLDDEPHPLGNDLDDLGVLGGEDALVQVLRRYRATRVVLAFSKRPHNRILEVIRAAGLKDVYLSIVPRYFEIMTANAEIVDVEGIPLVEIPAARLSRLERTIKRSFDLVLTVPGLILIAPLLVLIAVAIKIDSPGPVFFRQERRGRDESVFRIYKFRTMRRDAEEQRDELLEENESDGPLFKIRADPRVTRVGRLLRELSLDELPQLLNVVKGEMSLVGPRPFVVHEDEKIGGWARRRLDLTPGITGLWQVLGRNEIPYEEMVKLDYLYVNNWSLWWDARLLLRTLPIVFGRRGY